jgi:hypothetical protein
MESVLRLLVGIGSVFVCTIPERYRRWWPLRNESDLRGPAIASGVLEALIGAPGTTLYIAVGLNGPGIAGLVLNPFLPMAFMFFEGIVRMLAAVGPGQVLPALPFQVVAWIHTAGDRKARDLELGPLVVDEIERGNGKDFDLCVLSCRPKDHWNSYMTVRFDGVFYQVFRRESISGPRTHAYFLRKSPEWRHVVVVYEYRVEDVLNPAFVPERWKPVVTTPQF